MINFFQKSLYKLALISPIIIITIVLHSIQIHSISPLSWIVLTVAIVIMIYHFIFVIIISKKIPEIEIKLETTPVEDDKTIVKIAVTYTVPFIEWAVKCISFYKMPYYIIPGLVSVAIFVTLSVMNNTVPSPLYWLCGFHFHTIEVEGKTYRIMSKQKNYRNSKKIKNFKRIFDDLLLVV